MRIESVAREQGRRAAARAIAQPAASTAQSAASTAQSAASTAELMS